MSNNITEVSQASVREQAVPAGYKQTEVGLIPEDWAVTTLDLLNRSGAPAIKAGPFGSSLTKDMYVPDGYKIYGQEQVIKGDHNFGDYYINQEKFRQLQSCEVLEGDILLSLVGTAGKLLVVPQGAAKGIINPRLIRFRFNTFKVNPVYFKNLFESFFVQSYLSSSAQGGTMAVLSAGTMKTLMIPLPGIKEQTAIANALSDVDTLIDSLEALISKKQAIKTATMQQLLTGRTRLPQFAHHPDGSKKGYKQSELGEIPEDWLEFSLSELCDVRDGTHESPKYQEHGVPLVTSKNIVNDLLDLSNVSLISIEDALEVNKRSKVNLGDIIMSMIGTVGSAVLIDKEPKFCIKNVALFKPKKIKGEFLIQLIRSVFFQEYLEDSIDGGIQKFVSLGTLRNMNLVVPDSFEQTAIATILSDMDEELQALEQQLSKTRQLKQGMMQQLLTGKTRLPVEHSA